MNLWQVNGKKLHEIKKSALDNETRLEEWIAADATVLGLNVLIIGRQVVTASRGRIDLLAVCRRSQTLLIKAIFV